MLQLPCFRRSNPPCMCREICWLIRMCAGDNGTRDSEFGMATSKNPYSAYLTSLGTFDTRPLIFMPHACKHPLKNHVLAPSSLLCLTDFLRYKLNPETNKTFGSAWWNGWSVHGYCIATSADCGKEHCPWIARKVQKKPDGDALFHTLEDVLFVLCVFISYVYLSLLSLFLKAERDPHAISQFEVISCLRIKHRHDTEGLGLSHVSARNDGEIPIAFRTMTKYLQILPRVWLIPGRDI